MHPKKLTTPSLSFFGNGRYRKLAAWLVFFLLGILLIRSAPISFFDQPGMRAALMGSGTAALATALGTLPVLLSQNFTPRTFDGFMGFGAGVMLGASAFSLIMPALDSAIILTGSPLNGSALVGLGTGIGALLIFGLDKMLKAHIGVPGRTDTISAKNGGVWLFVLAIAAHNIPEGLAIGLAYAGVDVEKAHSLATGISIQDLPEGLIIAIALRGIGYGRWVSAAIGAGSGLVEPLAAFLGVHIIGIASSLLPWGLAVAAGAMLFVIVHDVIPECHRKGNGTLSSCLLIAGFILMLVVDAGMN